MNAPATRIKKEARTLFWPWCAVMFAGISPLLPFGHTTGYFSFRLFQLGFWIGIPLLAALSFGTEFQHGTMTLLLSQPMARMRIWFEKMMLLTAAVLATAAVYSLASLQDLAITGIWIVIVVCSSTFWTLVAKSSIGGLVLNLLQGIAILFIGQVAEWVLGPADSAGEIRTRLLIGCIPGLGYAFIMLWLGRRKFASLQSIGSTADSDVHMPIRLTHGTWARFLRCQPSGAVLNLIRKEVRLLWPVWLLMAACLVGVLGLGTLQMLPGISQQRLAIIAAVFIVAVNSLSIVLAGCLSMGEERTLGTQSWHLTLPISAGLQWFVKLAVALLAGFISLALPAVLAQLTFGQLFVIALGPGFANYGILFLAAISSLMSFAAFWSACVVKGTVRAVLWVFPAMGAVALAHRIGSSLGEILHMSPVLNDLILSWHPFPFSTATWSGLHSVLIYAIITSLFVPPLILALIQSRRLFRREIPDNLFFAARYLLPVALSAFLFSFAVRVPVVVMSLAGSHIYETIYATHAAVGKLRIDIANLDAAQPQQLTVEELSKVAPLSDTTRELLRGSTITVEPKGGDPKWLEIHKKHSEYFTTIRFRNNWDCTVYGMPYFQCNTPEGPFGNTRLPD